MGCMDKYKDWKAEAPFIVVCGKDECPCRSLERANKINRALFNDKGVVYTREQYDILIKYK